MTMTAKEKEDLANAIAEKIKEKGCPHGISAETAATLNEFAKAFRDTKITVRRAVILVIVPGVIVLIIAGVVAKLKGLINL
jgi:hypothetical protein